MGRTFFFERHYFLNEVMKRMVHIPFVTLRGSCQNALYTMGKWCRLSFVQLQCDPSNTLTNLCACHSNISPLWLKTKCYRGYFCSMLDPLIVKDLHVITKIHLRCFPGSFFHCIKQKLDVDSDQFPIGNRRVFHFCSLEMYIWLLPKIKNVSKLHKSLQRNYRGTTEMFFN